MGCAVFCRRAASGGFYAPRVELNDAGLDPYFPDGTWCHHDGSQDYYCLQHHCLPEVRRSLRNLKASNTGYFVFFLLVFEELTWMSLPVTFITEGDCSLAEFQTWTSRPLTFLEEGDWSLDEFQAWT